MFRSKTIGEISGELFQIADEGRTDVDVAIVGHGDETIEKAIDFLQVLCLIGEGEESLVEISEAKDLKIVECFPVFLFLSDKNLEESVQALNSRLWSNIIGSRCWRIFWWFIPKQDFSLIEITFA